MNNQDELFVKSLWDERDINNIGKIFKQYSGNYNKCIIIHFAIAHSTCYEEFREFSVNNFSVYGIANYDEAFLLDNIENIESNKIVKIGRVINLDINIIQYLNKVFNGKHIDNEDEFIEYLNQIKHYKITPNISTALIERMSTLYDNIDVLKEQVLSYVKFDTLNMITKENLQKDIPLPEDKRKWAYDIIKEVETHKNSIVYDKIFAIQSLVMKAFLLKLDNSLNKKEKIKELVKFCLIDLNAYMENELYLCSMYLNEEPNVKRTFEKIETVSKDTIRRIKNISWDLAHIRLIEEQMINDLEKGTIIFHYLGTYDIGLKNIININPIIIMGVLDGKPITVRAYDIQNLDVFDEDMMNYYINTLKNRPKETPTLEKVIQIHSSLSEEITNRQNNHFKNK